MRALCYLIAASVACLPLSAGEIGWETNFETAVTKSTESGKAMIVLFTGSDWCAWCKKLENEVFEDDGFCTAVGDKFVFMKADFPMDGTQDEQLKVQNAVLQDQFHIEGFPTLVILDEKQQKIATAGYQAGGGGNYAKYLLKILNDYSSYKQSLNQVAKRRMSANELEALYRKSIELGQKDDINTILAAGMVSENPTPFLLERYRFLAEADMSTTEEAQNIREYLVSSDPTNNKGVHYRLAVIDFQHKAERLEKGQGTAEEACAPLTGYIKRFGSSDTNNLWRLNMTIAQTFQSQGEYGRALKYARVSEKTAPEKVKGLVSETVRALESAGNSGRLASTESTETSGRS